MDETIHKSGYVVLVGRPNVGKSTLLNHLVGQKVSITSRRPQTTRDRILGIKTRPDAQLLYVDTPGIHVPKSQLNRYMMRVAKSALADVDVVVLVVEAGIFRDDDQRALDLARQGTAPVILVVNKVDRFKDKAALLPFLEAMTQRHDFAEIVPLSARRREDVQRLEDLLVRYLPMGEPFYGEDEITDKSMRFMAAELVREQVFRSFGQEVPYAMAVAIDEFKEEGRLTRIHATIYVERGGQKAILVGTGGERLKQIGQAARLELEKLLDRRVFLGLWVKVKSGWSMDARVLHSLGYHDGEN